MTHVQQYLKTPGNSLRTLFQRYNIESFSDEANGLCVLNYRMLSPMSEPIVQESRGMVLELGTWELAGKSINAFFAPSQAEADPIMKAFDWNSAYAIEKMDGTMVMFYFYKGEWRVATRISPTGFGAVHSMNGSINNLTWKELIEITLEEMGYTFDSFVSALDKNVYYTFELCAPENRCIVVYDKRRLYFIAAVNATTLEEMDIRNMAFPSLKPSIINATLLEDLNKIIETKDNPYQFEGYVVVDSSFRRLKVTNPQYASLLYDMSVRDKTEAIMQLKMMNEGGYVGVPSASTANSDILVEGGLGALSVFDEFLQTVMQMSQYIQSLFVNESVDPISASQYEIWPHAFDSLRAGKSMSEVLDESQEDDLYDATMRYKQFMVI